MLSNEVFSNPHFHFTADAAAVPVCRQSVARYTNAWTRQLQSADDLVCREQWPNAEAALSDLYGRWTEQQGWLHMIIVHQELDETEALLQRCIALAQQQDDAGLRSDIAELRTQFTLLSEMQRLTLRNIL